jgi:chitinase
VYSTTTYTITSCKPTVTDCPGKIGQVTTEVIPVYTTICPVEGSGYSASLSTQYTTTVQATTTVHLPAPGKPTTEVTPAVVITATVIPSSSAVVPVSSKVSTVSAGYSAPYGVNSTVPHASTGAPVPPLGSTGTTTGSVPIATAAGTKAGVSLALVAFVVFFAL